MFWNGNLLKWRNKSPFIWLLFTQPNQTRQLFLHTLCFHLYINAAVTVRKEFPMFLLIPLWSCSEQTDLTVKFHALCPYQHYIVSIFLLHFSTCVRKKVNRPTYFQQFSCPLLFPPVHVVGSENVPFLKWDLWMFYLTKNYLFRDQWRHKSAGTSNFCITVLLVANIRINFCVHRLKIHSMENQPITSPAMERHIWDKSANTLMVFIS